MPTSLDQRGEMRPEGTFCDAGAIEAPEPGFVFGLLMGLLAVVGMDRRRPLPR